MNYKESTPEELKKEIDDLEQKYNSVKELYEKEIIELRKKEESLRKSDEKYRIAYMTSPDAININRLSDGMYISVNE